MAIVETLAQEIRPVQVDGASVPRDCLGIIDESTKGTDSFAYHVVEGDMHRLSDCCPPGHSWGHLHRFSKARATTRCGKSIDGIGGQLSLFHTTKLCMDCARTIPGLMWTRQFKIAELNGEYVITEVAPTNLVSLDYREKTVSRSNAWDRARIQGLPVVYVNREGVRRELGEVFNPELFEQAAYTGYTQAGFIMTDGYYAPLQFETWVASFRRNPVLDEPEQEHLAPMLRRYVDSLPLRQD